MRRIIQNVKRSVDGAIDVLKGDFTGDKQSMFVTDEVFEKDNQLFTRFSWYSPGVLWVEIVLESENQRSYDRLCTFNMTVLDNTLRIANFTPLPLIVKLRITIGEIKGTFIPNVLNFVVGSPLGLVTSEPVKEFFASCRKENMIYLFFDDCEPEDIFKLDPEFSDKFYTLGKKYFYQEDFGKEQLSDLLYTVIEIRFQEEFLSEEDRKYGQQISRLERSMITVVGESENTAILQTAYSKQFKFKWEFNQTLNVTFPDGAPGADGFILIPLITDFYWQAVLYTWAKKIVHFNMEIHINLSAMWQDVINDICTKNRLPIQVLVRPLDGIVSVYTTIYQTAGEKLNTGRRKLSVLNEQLASINSEVDKAYSELPKGNFPRDTRIEIDNKYDVRERKLITEYNDLLDKKTAILKEKDQYDKEKGKLAEDGYELGKKRKRKTVEPPQRSILPTLQRIASIGTLATFEALTAAGVEGNFVNYMTWTLRIGMLAKQIVA